MINYIKKYYEKNFTSAYFITFITLLLIVFFPQMAYAEGLAGYGVLIFIILHLTLFLSSVISFFIKFGLFKLIPGRTFNTSYTSILTVMFGELIIMFIGIWLLLLITTDSFVFDHFRIINYLSAISPDSAFLALQNIIIEHKHYLVLTVKLIFFVIIMFFVNSTLNIRFLQRKGDQFTTAIKNKSHFFYAGLLGIIAPAIFCVTINYFLIKKHESRELAGEYTIVGDYDKQMSIMLFKVVKAGYPRLVELMINRGADIYNVGWPEMTAKNQWTALHLSITNMNNLATVKLLLEKGADINRKDKKGFTALIKACSDTKATPKMIQLLINHGSDVNEQDNYGRTALIVASSRNRGSAKYGVKSNEIEQKLIDNGAHVNIQSKSGQTALIEAAKAGNIELARMLIKHGADVSVRDKDGKTAYMLSQNDQMKALFWYYGAKEY